MKQVVENNNSWRFTRRAFKETKYIIDALLATGIPQKMGYVIEVDAPFYSYPFSYEVEGIKATYSGESNVSKVSVWIPKGDYVTVIVSANINWDNGVDYYADSYFSEGVDFHNVRDLTVYTIKSMGEFLDPKRPTIESAVLTAEDDTTDSNKVITNMSEDLNTNPFVEDQFVDAGVSYFNKVAAIAKKYGFDYPILYISEDYPENIFGGELDPSIEVGSEGSSDMMGTYMRFSKGGQWGSLWDIEIGLISHNEDNVDYTIGNEHMDQMHFTNEEQALAEADRMLSAILMPQRPTVEQAMLSLTVEDILDVLTADEETLVEATKKEKKPKKLGVFKSFAIGALAGWVLGKWGKDTGTRGNSTKHVFSVGKSDIWGYLPDTID